MLSLRRLRGVRLAHKKRTRLAHTIEMPAPNRVFVPLLQHIGVPCTPLVAAGDRVLVGQLIGDSDAFVSSPVHSPVSGTVVGISEVLNVTNESVGCIVIESDGKNELSPLVAPPSVETREDFLRAVRSAGIVGLGGAGFPTHAKLAYKDIEKVHTLYINLAECEPYITTDNREVFENVLGIIDGIQLVLKYTGIPKAVVVLENNKPIGTQILALHLSEIPEIDIKIIGNKYPKGAEKVLVYEAGGPVIGRGQLPADCGVIVLNVSTVAAISAYIRTGMPLIRRRVTIDGDMIESPKNILAPVGTPISDLLSFAGIDLSHVKMALNGGAMMGNCVIDLDQPVTKTTNAIICFKNFYDRHHTPCINCGRCIRVCPINLSPAVIEKAYDRRDAKTLVEFDADLCMNCGCCSYVCPAKRDLSHKIQLAKRFVRSGGEGFPSK